MARHMEFVIKILGGVIAIRDGVEKFVIFRL